MALSNQELLVRITQLETFLNKLQKAINNAASKQQLISWVNVRQAEIISLQAEVQDIKEQVASGGGSGGGADPTLVARIVAIESAPYATQGDVNAEAIFRISADAGLSTRIDAIEGSSGAGPVFTELSNKVNTEITGRYIADTQLGAVTSGEALLRANRDTALTNALNNEITSRLTSDTELGALTSGEIIARTAANSILTNRDSALTSALNTEITQRMTADTTLGGLVSGLISAGTSNPGLQAALDNEIISRMASDTQLGSLVSGEIVTRTSADSVLTNRDAALTTALNNEINQRIASVQAVGLQVSGIIAGGGSGGNPGLAIQINNEIIDRMSSDVQLGALASGEVTNRINAVTAQALALGNEITSRMASDTALGALVSGEIINRTSADTILTNRDTALTTALNSEITQRMAADVALGLLASGAQGGGGGPNLTVPLNNEILSRMLSDVELGALISGEIPARVNRDIALTTALNLEISQRMGSDVQLGSLVSGEITSRTSAEQVLTNRDTALTTALNNEINQRIASGQDLGLQISGIIAGGGSGGNPGLAIALNNEIISRMSSDVQLGALISGEIPNRISADSAIVTALNSEITTRMSSDTTLGGLVSGEITNRTAADSVLTNRDTALTTALNSEITSRMSSDTALGALVSGEIASRTSADTVLTNRDTGLTTALNTEISSRMLSDTALGALVSGEITNRAADDIAQSGMITSLNNKLTASIGYVSVKSFGAIGNGIANDTVALQAAIDSVKATGGTLYIPAGIYLFSNLNMTLINTGFNKTFRVRGDGPEATILRQLTGGTGNAIDISGSNWIGFESFQLQPGPNSDIGLLASRITGGVNCNFNTFVDFWIKGSAAKASFVNIGAECMTVDRCWFETGGQAVFWNGAYNNIGATSAFGTIQNGVPNTANHIHNTRFGTSISSGVCIWLSDGAGIDFNSCETYATGANTLLAHVYIDAPQTNEFGWMTKFDKLHAEGNGDVFVFATGASPPTNAVYRSFHITNSVCINSGYDWINVTGNNVIHEDLVFENNVGPYPVVVRDIENSIIHHFEPNATVVIGASANACDILVEDGGLTGNLLGSKLSLVAPYGDIGKNYDVYGAALGQGGRYIRYIPATSAPANSQLSPGVYAVADPNSWNPANVSTTRPYPMFFDGIFWKSMITDPALNTLVSGEIIARTSADSVLTNRDTALTTALNNEINQRIASVQDLGGQVSGIIAGGGSSGNPGLSIALNSEITSRMLSDVQLGALISGEIPARQNRDTALTTALDIEITSRMASDTQLGSLISGEISSRTLADSILTNRDAAINSALDNEINSRMSADTALGALVSGVIASGGGGNTAGLTTALNNEIISRMRSDTELGSLISGEILQRMTSDVALGALASGEVTARTSADIILTNRDTALTTALNNEITQRISAGQLGGTQYSGEVTLRTNRDTALTTALNLEITQRMTADVQLGLLVSGEPTVRANRDIALTTALDAEINSRMSSDTQLGLLVSGEPAVRASRDTAITSALDAEIAQRMSSDVVLGSLVSGVISGGANSAALTTALNNEIVSRMRSDTDLGFLVSGEIPQRMTSDVALGALASGEIVRATAVETVLTNRDAGLTTALNTEIISRMQSDTALGALVSGVVGGGGALDFTHFQAESLDDADAFWTNPGPAVIADAVPAGTGVYVRNFTGGGTGTFAGGKFRIPSTATNMKFEWIYQNSAAPGTTNNKVQWRLAARPLGTRTAATNYDFTTHTTANDSSFATFNETISVASLGLTSGNMYQFQIGRTTSGVVNNMTQNALLSELIITWT